MLMAKVARVVKDKRVLKLIRAYLESGVMLNGVAMETEEGTPQGGPLSPLLSNIMLNAVCVNGLRQSFSEFSVAFLCNSGPDHHLLS
jgi:retron-type reverse transcriptase